MGVVVVVVVAIALTSSFLCSGGELESSLSWVCAREELVTSLVSLKTLLSLLRSAIVYVAYKVRPQVR